MRIRVGTCDQLLTSAITIFYILLTAPYIEFNAYSVRCIDAAFAKLIWHLVFILLLHTLTQLCYIVQVHAMTLMYWAAVNKNVYECFKCSIWSSKFSTETVPHPRSLYGETAVSEICLDVWDGGPARVHRSTVAADDRWQQLAVFLEV